MYKRCKDCRTICNIDAFIVKIGFKEFESTKGNSFSLTVILHYSKNKVELLKSVQTASLIIRRKERGIFGRFESWSFQVICLLLITLLFLQSHDISQERSQTLERKAFKRQINVRDNLFPDRSCCPSFINRSNNNSRCSDNVSFEFFLEEVLDICDYITLIHSKTDNMSNGNRYHSTGNKCGTNCASVSALHSVLYTQNKKYRCNNLQLKLEHSWHSIQVKL